VQAALKAIQVWHTPPSYWKQELPPQHAELEVQAEPLARQVVQTWFELGQARPLQQSAVELHASPLARQQAAPAAPPHTEQVPKVPFWSSGIEKQPLPTAHPASLPASGSQSCSQPAAVQLEPGSHGIGCVTL
jgi:hypothetical protein